MRMNNASGSPLVLDMLYNSSREYSMNCDVIYEYDRIYSLKICFFFREYCYLFISHGM